MSILLQVCTSARSSSRLTAARNLHHYRAMAWNNCLPASGEKQVQRSSFATSGSSRPSLIDNTDPIKIKDGGLIAWIHCLSAFLLFFTGWGIVNSFG